VIATTLMFGDPAIQIVTGADVMPPSAAQDVNTSHRKVVGSAGTMRKTRLALTKTKVDGRRYYCVTLPKLGGGRNRRFFKDKAEAQTFLQMAEVQQENYGTAALSIFFCEDDATRAALIEAGACQRASTRKRNCGR